MATTRKVARNQKKDKQVVNEKNEVQTRIRLTEFRLFYTDGMEIYRKVDDKTIGLIRESADTFYCFSPDLLVVEAFPKSKLDSWEVTGVKEEVVAED